MLNCVDVFLYCICDHIFEKNLYLLNLTSITESMCAQRKQRENSNETNNFLSKSSKFSHFNEIAFILLFRNEAITTIILLRYSIRIN